MIRNQKLLPLATVVVRVAVRTHFQWVTYVAMFANINKVMKVGVSAAA